jgi:hypothetical protein
LQIFDLDRRSLCYYFINEDNTICNNVIDVSAKYNLYLQNFFDLDSLYLATGMNGILNNKRFVVFNKSFELIDGFEEYPVLDYNKEKNKKFKENLLNIYFIKISPDKKNLAFASYKTGLLEVFSLNELPEKIIKVKSLLFAPPMKNNSEDIFGFEDVFVTNRYIYTLYNGKTADENPYYSKSIKVFDWNGNFTVEYHTGIDMRCLAVDENNKIIYAIAYSDEKGFFLIQINEMIHI